MPSRCGIVGCIGLRSGTGGRHCDPWRVGPGRARFSSAHQVLVGAVVETRREHPPVPGVLDHRGSHCRDANQQCDGEPPAARKLHGLIQPDSGRAAISRLEGREPRRDASGPAGCRPVPRMPRGRRARAVLVGPECQAKPGQARSRRRQNRFSHRREGGRSVPGPNDPGLRQVRR